MLKHFRLQGVTKQKVSCNDTLDFECASQKYPFLVLYFLGFSSYHLTNRWVYSNGESNDIAVNEKKTEGQKENCSHVLSLLPWWNSFLNSEYGMYAITGLD